MGRKAQTFISGCLTRIRDTMSGRKMGEQAKSQKEEVGRRLVFGVFGW